MELLFPCPRAQNHRNNVHKAFQVVAIMCMQLLLLLLLDPHIWMGVLITGCIVTAGCRLFGRRHQSSGTSSPSVLFQASQRPGFTWLGDGTGDLGDPLSAWSRSEVTRMVVNRGVGILRTICYSSRVQLLASVSILVGCSILSSVPLLTASLDSQFQHVHHFIYVLWTLTLLVSTAISPSVSFISSIIVHSSTEYSFRLLKLAAALSFAIFVSAVGLKISMPLLSVSSMVVLTVPLGIYSAISANRLHQLMPNSPSLVEVLIQQSTWGSSWFIRYLYKTALHGMDSASIVLIFGSVSFVLCVIPSVLLQTQLHRSAIPVFIPESERQRLIPSTRSTTSSSSSYILFILMVMFGSATYSFQTNPMDIAESRNVSPSLLLISSPLIELFVTLLTGVIPTFSEHLSVEAIQELCNGDNNLLLLVSLLQLGLLAVLQSTAGGLLVLVVLLRVLSGVFLEVIKSAFLHSFGHSVHHSFLGIGVTAATCIGCSLSVVIFHRSVDVSSKLLSTFDSTFYLFYLFCSLLCFVSTVIFGKYYKILCE